MAEKMLSAKDIAARFGVKISTARGWLHRRLFPGAQLKHSELGVPYWAVPESALKSFTPPRPGPVPKAKDNGATKKATKKGRK